LVRGADVNPLLSVVALIACVVCVVVAFRLAV
jgi:hypothetical protein